MPLHNAAACDGNSGNGAEPGRGAVAGQQRKCDHRVNGAGTVVFPSPANRSTHVRARKMRAQFPRKAKQLIYVTLPVADVNATHRITQQLGRLAQILQPADAFFLLDGHTRRIDPALQGIGTMKRVPIPKLDCGQTKWQSFASGHEAGMHQDAAGGVIFTSVAYG